MAQGPDLAHVRPRPIPETIVAAGAGEKAQDGTILKMLGARDNHVTTAVGTREAQK